MRRYTMAKRGRKHGSITKARRLKAKDLAPTLLEMNRRLKKAGVKAVGLPKPDALVFQISLNLKKWLDWDKVDEWIDEYAKHWK
jgi:hypothetical protein